MRLPRPTLPGGQDRLLGLAYAAIESVRAWLDTVPMLDGALVKGIVSSAGVTSDGISLAAGVDTTIDHGLGREWRGWFVVRTYGGAAVNPARIKESTSQPDATKHVALIATDACTVWIWVW